MTLIDLMQAFEKASIGVLNATEQAVYIRLALIWNGLRRPEWFSVSDPQLKREAGIKSHHTIAKARKTLQDKGFVSIRKTGRGVALIFHLNQIPTTANNAVPTAENAVPTTAKNAIGGGQNLPYPTAENAVPPRQKMPTSQSTEIYTEYTESLSKDSNDIEIHRPPERETPSLPPDLLKYYMERFNPEPKSREKEKLAIWAEQYTKEKVKEAIDAGAENGASHINYIGAILRNGGTTNDNSGRQRQAQRQAQRRFRQPTEEERRAKWDAEARKYGAGSYAHRGAAGVCGDQETVSEGDIPGY